MLGGGHPVELICQLILKSKEGQPDQGQWGEGSRI